MKPKGQNLFNLELLSHRPRNFRNALAVAKTEYKIGLSMSSQPPSLLSYLLGIPSIRFAFLAVALWQRQP